MRLTGLAETEIWMGEARLLSVADTLRKLLGLLCSRKCGHLRLNTLVIAQLKLVTKGPENPVPDAGHELFVVASVFRGANQRDTHEHSLAGLLYPH